MPMTDSSSGGGTDVLINVIESAWSNSPSSPAFETAAINQQTAQALDCVEKGLFFLLNQNAPEQHADEGEIPPQGEFGLIGLAVLQRAKRDFGHGVF
ncbi:MAG TPA: hypothetical protein VK639_07885 [Terriglobales bacterium]|jgi:hypothetical protein|nr:hypothetical protein [Terriglobales bacterium]